MALTSLEGCDNMTSGRALNRKLDEFNQDMDKTNQQVRALNMSMEEMDRCLKEKTPLTKAYLELLIKDIRGDEKGNENQTEVCDI